MIKRSGVQKTVLEEVTGEKIKVLNSEVSRIDRLWGTGKGFHDVLKYIRMYVPFFWEWPN